MAKFMRHKYSPMTCVVYFDQLWVLRTPSASKNHLGTLLTDFDEKMMDVVCFDQFLGTEPSTLLEINQKHWQILELH